MKFLRRLIKCFSATEWCLIAIAVLLLSKTPRPPAAIFMRQSLCGNVIWEGYVSADDWCEVVAWEGSTLYKTQQVVYTQFKNLQKYRENSLDNLGWVWYYDVGRKCESNQVVAGTLDRSQTNVTTW